MHQITATMVQDRQASLKADARVAARKRDDRYPLVFNRFRLAVPAFSRRDARSAPQVAA